MSDILNAQFIIDGTAQDFTPAQMLDECNGFLETQPAEGRSVVDETIDPNALVPELYPSLSADYSALVRKQPEKVSAVFPEAATKASMAAALADTLWAKGEHTVDDLSLNLKWTWNTPGKVGDMAALYLSTEAAADYAGSLGIGVDSYEAEEGEGRMVEVSVNGAQKGRACPAKADEADAKSWIVYVPLDTCAYRLGGSKLLAAMGATGSSAPQIVDADYFLDCYEVLRELVEDGVIIAGATVGRGGLQPALEDFSGGRFSCAGIKEAYPQCSEMEILFGEVPGVLIQIKDDDFDYLDAELLLQDVAFYPLGHPSEGKTEIKCEAEHSLNKILDSIIQSSASEGED